MGRYDKPDVVIEGQITIDEYLTPPDRLIAVSRIFARARKNMSLAEQKTFVYALSKIKFTETTNDTVVRMDKKILAQIIGIHSDPDHLSGDLYNEIRELTTHSYIEISERDLGLYSNGYIVSALTRYKNTIRLRLNEEYMPLFSGLSNNYITLWSSDIFGMSSRRSVQFYEYLRQITDTRQEVNSVVLGVKALKDMFEIPKEAYMREKGGFDRSNFEARVIEPLCDDMSKCRMIQLLMQSDGHYYVKEKQGNRVIGYRFHWVYTSHPAVSSAEEVQQIQERVDQDPEVLRVARDIVAGEKKAKTKKSKFTTMQERDYDWTDLEKQLLRAQEIPGQRSIEDYPEFMPE